MSDTEQRPFEDSSPFDAAEFVDNPEPRCACVLLVDTSTSMAGNPVRQLNEGLRAFQQELASDGLAAKRVEVAIVGFGPAKVLAEFASADAFAPPKLVANGDTPMGAAINLGIDLLAQRKEAYKAAGISYYRPWMFLITDGSPTDAWPEAARRVREAEEKKQLQLFAVGVEGANMEMLAKLAVRAPLQLKGLQFRELFSWLSRSLQNVSRSQVGQNIALENPATPSGWATVG